MKKLKVLVVFLSCVMLLAGCEPYPYGGDKRLVRCIEYDAPSIDLMLGTTEELEKDEYGRILFRYDMGEKGNNFLGICQGYTKNTTTFYQDFCTVQHVNGTNRYTEEEIRKLKEQNDWGKPLEPSKMTLINFEEKSNARDGLKNETIKKDFGIEVIDYSGAMAYTDGDGNQLYYFRAIKDGEESYYFLILDREHNYKSKDAIVRTDWPGFQPGLHEFKVKNGWDFSTGYPGYQ